MRHKIQRQRDVIFGRVDTQLWKTVTRVGLSQLGDPVEDRVEDPIRVRISLRIRFPLRDTAERLAGDEDLFRRDPD